MNKKELIIGIVSLVLVFAIIFAFVAVIGNIDKITDGFGDLIQGSDDTSNGTDNSTDKPSSGTEKPTTTEKPSTGTDVPSGGGSDIVELPTFYVTRTSDGKDDIGFSKVGDKYYFFVAAHAPEDKNNGMCFKTWHLERLNVKAGNTASDVYSVDGGFTWKSFGRSVVENDSSLVDLYMEESVSTSTPIYICYSVQLNCTDPMSFLNTMKNALGSRVSYKYTDEGIENIDCMACGGLYTRYEKFLWAARHVFDEYEIPDYM